MLSLIFINAGFSAGDTLLLADIRLGLCSSCFEFIFSEFLFWTSSKLEHLSEDHPGVDENIVRCLGIFIFRKFNKFND